MRAPLLALLLCACGSGGTVLPRNSPTPITWNKDVQPLVAARCRACHLPGGIAPISFETYAEGLKWKDAIRAAVETRRMPPYLAGPGCAEYVDDQRLTDAEIATFGRWVDQGAAEGDPSQVQPQVDVPDPGLSRVDLTLQMPEAFTPTQIPDEYRCFVLDWPKTTDSYAVGMQVVPGNTRVVHHVIAFVIPPEQVAAVQALDDAEAGPGYTCFGGPGTSGQRTTWLGAWAPGGKGSMYPPDTGLEVKAGSKVVLQVHYNVSAAPAGERTDLTRIDVATADTVKRKAMLMLWANPDWISKKTMTIPAFAKDTRYSFAFDPTPYMGAITGGVIGSGMAFKVYSASLHQHLLGTSSKLEILRDNQPNECLLNVPRWDFHWQRSYGFKTPKVFRPGDRLNVECHWDNSAEAQPVLDGQKRVPREVNWGEGTDSEMCLGVLYISQ